MVKLISWRINFIKTFGFNKRSLTSIAKDLKDSAKRRKEYSSLYADSHSNCKLMSLSHSSVKTLEH